MNTCQLSLQLAVDSICRRLQNYNLWNKKKQRNQLLWFLTIEIIPNMIPRRESDINSQSSIATVLLQVMTGRQCRSGLLLPVFALPKKQTGWIIAVLLLISEASSLIRWLVKTLSSILPWVLRSKFM